MKQWQYYSLSSSLYLILINQLHPHDLLGNIVFIGLSVMLLTHAIAGIYWIYKSK
jgi:hypothetical protein